MNFKDYYVTLEVAHDASEQEIKRTYRRLVRQYHPDVNQGDHTAEEKFKEISEAYYVIGNAERRQQYNAIWQQYQQWKKTGGHTSTRIPNTLYNPFVIDWFGLGMISNVLNAFMSNEGQTKSHQSEPTPQTHEPAQTGNDLEIKVDISLEEAWQGTSRMVDVEQRRLKIYIPPGVRTGTELFLEGQGYAGTGGLSNGDLYLVVQVAEHECFDREGDDLYTDLTVDMYTAILGGEVSVQTLNGNAMLSVPPLTQADEIFCLPRRGMPRLQKDDQFGNLYARVKLVLPEALTESEIKSLRRLANKRRIKKVV